MKVVIFGAGMTGLVAGRELARHGHHIEIYEASEQVGGLAKTYRDPDGFTYDNGPRFIFSTLAEKIGIAHLCEPVKYLEDIYVGERYYPFPFGFIRNPRYLASAGTATLTRGFKRTPRNLGEFLQTYYGRTFSGEVLVPLIEKWAGIPAPEISVDFASRLLPTNIAYIIHSLIKKLRGGVTEDYYRKGRFIVYPRTSNAAIFDELVKAPGVNVKLHSRLDRLITENHRVISAEIGGKSVGADYFLSTIPIHRLATILDNPKPIRDWGGFRYRGILLLFIKVNRPRVLEHLWTWFPEKKFRFYRISEFKNAREDLAPKEKTLICIELASETTDPIWTMTKEEIYSSLERDLRYLYSLKREEIIGLELKKSEFAYPVMRSSTEDLQRSLAHQTPFHNLFIAGRTGMFQYRMLEGCYESAMICVEAIRATMGELNEVEQHVLRRDRYGRPELVPE